MIAHFRGLDASDSGNDALASGCKCHVYDIPKGCCFMVTVKSSACSYVASYMNWHA